MKGKQLVFELMASPTLTPALSQRERVITQVSGSPFSCFCANMLE